MCIESSVAEIIHKAYKFSDLTIYSDSIYKSLGYGDIENPMVMEMIHLFLEEIDTRISPNLCFRIFDQVKIKKGEGIQVEDQFLSTGKLITGHLKKMRQFGVYACTLGEGYSKWMQELNNSGDVLGSYLLSEIASNVVESLSLKLFDELRFVTDLIATNKYSPGYCDWNVKDQEKLFKLIPNNPCNITLTESCMMYPVKSISGIFGLGESVRFKAHDCSACNYDGCVYSKIN